MKKIVGNLLCIAALAASMLTFGGCEGNPRELTREDILAESYAEADRMNSESWFGKYNGEECEFLMDTTGTGYLPLNFLENGTMVACMPFGDEGSRTTLITLGSPDVDLYGIRIGDNAEQAGAVLKEKGYVFNRTYSLEYYDSPIVEYCKGYIAVGLFHTDDGTIEIINIEGVDPMYTTGLYGDKTAE